MTEDPALLRSYLKAKRDFYGADTPIGHRCSNLMKQIESLDFMTDREARADLKKRMALQMRELEALLCLAWGT
jgi:hypothetical protein